MLSRSYAITRQTVPLNFEFIDSIHDLRVQRQRRRQPEHAIEFCRRASWQGSRHIFRDLIAFQETQ